MFNPRILVSAAVVAGIVVGGVTVATATTTTPVWLCNPITGGQGTVSGGTAFEPSCAGTNVVGLGLTYVASGVGGKPSGVSNYSVQIASPPAAGLTIDTPNGDGADITGATGTGVAISQSGGVGLSVANSKGTALAVAGTAKFSTSGLATVGAHKHSVVIGGVKAGTGKVLATLQGAQTGVAIEGVTKHATSLTITLTKPTTKSMKVAWFVIG